MRKDKERQGTDRLPRCPAGRCDHTHLTRTVRVGFTPTARIRDTATQALLPTLLPLSCPHCPGVWTLAKSGLVCSFEENPGCVVTLPCSWALPGGGTWGVSGQRLWERAWDAGTNDCGRGAAEPGRIGCGVFRDPVSASVSVPHTRFWGAATLGTGALPGCRPSAHSSIWVSAPSAHRLAGQDLPPQPPWAHTWAGGLSSTLTAPRQRGACPEQVLLEWAVDGEAFVSTRDLRAGWWPHRRSHPWPRLLPELGTRPP